MSEIKKLEHQLKTGRITRREFLVRVSALGLVAAVSPTLLTTAAKAATPKKGGRFRAGVPAFSTTDTLDPATLTDIGNYFIGWQVRNNLIELDYEGNAIPELAESMEASADAANWTFKLRKGVEFHNGKTLEAEDVIYSFNHHRGEKSKSGGKAMVAQIKDIKADGKNTVIFELTGGNADFPFILSDYHFAIFPVGTKGAEFDKGVGTGGYILESFEPGVRAFVKRNPNYWKEGRAHFDEVETISISDVNTRTNALKTNQIDWMPRVEVKTAHLLKKIKGIRVIQASGTFHYDMPMHMDVPPYNNNDVRLALKYAIDRKQMLDKALFGYGYVGNDHPIGRIQRFYASELPQITYDPDKAKYHLKKAGMQGHAFKLHTSSHAGFIDHAMLYKEQAAKAGINIELVRHPTDGYWSAVWLKKDFCSSHWHGRITSDFMFSIAYSGDAPWNESHFRNDRFEKLLVEARAELGENKRREMYYEMQKIVRDEGSAIIYVFRDFVEAVNEKVKFEKFAGTNEGDGARAAERWWFES